MRQGPATHSTQAKAKGMPGSLAQRTPPPLRLCCASWCLNLILAELEPW